MTAGGASGGVSGSDFYTEGAGYRAPGGMLRLCEKTPALCTELYTRAEVSKVLRALPRWSRKPVRHVVDDAAMDELELVNVTVNAMIQPEEDRRDTWSLSAQTGDCEDYALMKREALVAIGWPRMALRIAVGQTRWGVNHAVLIARTQRGDLVLDNLTDKIVTIGDAPHFLWAVESATTLGKWVQMKTGGGKDSAPVATLEPSRPEAKPVATVQRAASFRNVRPATSTFRSYSRSRRWRD